VGDHKHSGKRAVNRHQTQSKVSAGAQERAIERVERQRGRKTIVAEMPLKHLFPIIFDGKPADFCTRCGALKSARNYDPVCHGSREAREALSEDERRPPDKVRKQRHTDARKCAACSGSGYYDNTGSPPCGSCNGTGLKGSA
jgi:hypothetical protein